MKHLIVLGCKVKQNSSLKFSLKFWIKLKDNRPNVAQQQMSDIQESWQSQTASLEADNLNHIPAHASQRSTPQNRQFPRMQILSLLGTGMLMPSCQCHQTWPSLLALTQALCHTMTTHVSSPRLLQHSYISTCHWRGSPGTCLALWSANLNNTHSSDIHIKHNINHMTIHQQQTQWQNYE